MDDKTRLLELTKLFLQSVQVNKIVQYRPYPWQREFHEAGIDNPERMLMAANRCVSPWTVVETVPRSRRIVELIGEKASYVRSWADGYECISQASGVFLKGIEPAFRIHLDNGEWFDCSRKHRVLTCEGWLSLGQLIHLSSGLSWSQTLEDYRASCGEDDRLCDERFLLAAGSDLEPLPSPGDVRKHGLVFEQRDAVERISRCIHAFPVLDRCSSLDDPRQIADLCETFSDPEPYIDALRRSGTHREILRFVDESFRLQRDGEESFRLSSSRLSSAAPIEVYDAGNMPAIGGVSGQGHTQSVSPYGVGEVDLQFRDDADRIKIFYPLNHPRLIGENRIISVIPLGFQLILDFTVENTNSYRAAGVIHHNTGKTSCAACEVSYHLTGDYPNWWTGKTFEKPTLVWTGSPTNETSKDIVQAELVGDLGESLGTGWVPRARIVGRPTTRQAGVKNVIDSFKVRHKSGGLSTCVLKTYEQGWQKWQGTAPHVVWLDEEPDDYKIFSEAQTRILTSHGIVFVTFTPLLGVTELVEHFMSGGDGIHLKGATWDDAPHLSEEDKKRLAASYRDHEREARTKGVPMMGEGAVFPVADEKIKIDPFEIPGHWARIKGCDFGIDHPAAGCEIAWDRDQDVIYLIACYRKKDETAPYHAAWFNKSNDFIPVAWPHDGMNREKQGGKTLAQHYRDHGVNMMTKSARYPRAPGEEKDKGGPQPVEPIVDEMLERMQTERFKAFSNLPEFFEEKRSYHRKDGKIVDRRDDILKAVMYSIMMKRYAVSINSALRGSKSQPPARPIATTSL